MGLIQSQATETRAPADASGATPARILVVEDERIVARDLEGMLTALGYVVPATVTTGEDALSCVRDLRPDVVLMDIRLPGIVDGIQAARWLHEHDDIPVVFLTAHSDDDTLRRAMQTEPFGYVVKPFSASQLHCAIEIALHRRQTNARLRLGQAEVERGLADHTSMGVILTDDTGCPVYMNARAEALLVRGSAKAGHFGISVPNGSETDHLQALVRAGAYGRSGEMTSRHDEGELRWRVVPLDPDPVQGVAIASSVRVAVFVSEMAVTVPPWQCIAARCSLTQAEARLAAALTNGQSLKDIVRRTGISIETARSQLKACFAKTGTHRQSELVCLLLKGVSVHDPPNRKSR